MSPRIILIAFLGAAALGALLAWLIPVPQPEAPGSYVDPGPAPAEISALLEEAKRIAKEAAG